MYNNNNYNGNYDYGFDFRKFDRDNNYNDKWNNFDYGWDDPEEYEDDFETEWFD